MYCSFGKFAENSRKSEVAIDSNTGEYYNDYVCNKDIIVKDRKIIDENNILVSYESSDYAYDIARDNTCCFIGSFITSYARMQLYRFINYLQNDENANRMVYCDTDCCVYEYDKEILEHGEIPEYFNYITGSLGIDSELEKKDKEDEEEKIRNYISKWVSLGPKCYIGIDKYNRITKSLFSCKGISRLGYIIDNNITSDNILKEEDEQKKLFDIFKSYVFSDFSEDKMPSFKLKNQFLKNTDKFKLYQFDTIKKLNTREFKRVIIKTEDPENDGIFTVPYGYKPPNGTSFL